MNKMAMFLEGRAELEFNSSLIQEIARHRAITIETRKLRGTVENRRSQLITTLETDGKGLAATHHFLLFDCGGESLVKSRMMAEYEPLSNSGYSEIFCHRDVAPNVARKDIAKLEAGLPYKVKTQPIRVRFVLSVMEVEAWFLAEHSHFEKIDPSITVAAIAAALGFDPSDGDMQLRPAPCEDLGRCYALAGKQYDKLNTQPTIDAIDYVRIYLELVEKFPHLKLLCDAISDFLDT